MKKGEIIKNGNMNLNNLQVKGLPPEVVKLVKSKVDPIEFAVAFYLWSKDNIHAIPTGNSYRLRPEEFKIKHDLKSVVKYFEEKVYNG